MFRIRKILYLSISSSNQILLFGAKQGNIHSTKNIFRSLSLLQSDRVLCVCLFYFPYSSKTAEPFGQKFDFLDSEMVDNKQYKLCYLHYKHESKGFYIQKCSSFTFK